MSERLSVVGAGGHAKVVIATARALGWEVVAAYDDDLAKVGTDILGVPVRGPLGDSGDIRGAAVLALGNNRLRARLGAELALDWRSLVHPDATVDPSVEVRAGVVVFAGAVVQPDTVLGDHAIVNTGATIDHDGRIGACAHIAPGAHLAGEVTVDEGGFVGIGAAVINGRHVGAWAVVGAGAAVTRDVPAGATVVGVPARVRS